jgi:N-acetylglucosamine kinase-like BadF-type ATPase
MPSDSQRRFAVGVNGGATRTQFVLIDNELATLARLTSSSTNFRNVGLEAAYHMLNAGINQVIAQAGLSTAQIAAIGLGLAGADNGAARHGF